MAPRPGSPRARTGSASVGLAIAPALHGEAQGVELARHVRARIAVGQVQAKAYALAERQRFVLPLG